MDKKNLYRWLGIGALVLILVVYLISRAGSGKVSESPSTQIPSVVSTSTGQTPSATVPAPVKRPTTVKPSIPTGQTASEAYLSALNVYQKTGYYMQFFPCQATPGSMILKKGSKIMLDNRDAKSHLIGIRSVRYNIGAYNFAITSLDSLGTNYVTCDGGGVAQITVVP